MPAPLPKPTARAFWSEGNGRGAIRPVALAEPGSDEVRVRALHSGISRGTESLVFRGQVPESEHRRMRAPFQEGDFDGPVKYGYSSVGVVEAGPASLLGQTVFCLHPHQTAYVVPAVAVHPVPASVPPARAVLAANLETAVNALWDAGPLPGDRICVVGAGVVGLLVAWLAARIPGCVVESVDTNPARAALAARLGARFADPATATGDADLVVHASGDPGGLATALGLAGFEATVLELSWYGNRPVTVPLGESFHARRLRLVSSQVGAVATPQRGRWTHVRRMRLALELLVDDRLDCLVTGGTPFDSLPELMARLADGDAALAGALCERIDY